MSDINAKISKLKLGPELRQVREIKKITQREAAQALYLSVDMINALETHQENKLPPAVFVRGYLYHYALYLNVPELFSAFYGPKKNTFPGSVSLESSLDLNSTIDYKLSDQKNIKNKLAQNIGWKKYMQLIISCFSAIGLRLLNYIVLIILILLVFIWWHDRHHAIQKELALNNFSVYEIPFKKISLNNNLDNKLDFTDTDLSPLKPWWPFETGEKM